ncbi:MAG: NADH-quinone oxidoreductase subunit NuoN [Candidatus Pelagibacterales bacterium]|jgi:NADH-quinone oxidoreductase subunit N|nr:NADH-quinone oxidoreductase subunit NuoN [Pelagibacterales bacterium]MDA9864929.1 NADH-quinone oxidoreductase subunit NuoN [Pelagibacterales bacterium]MDB9818650.1 NADH-quinone oxidoreductase subunit NuoN [Pelagibacterales bacterium]|tara:strand:- start:2261 stop:3670 length:1410 start_codon:yes stop_codon:yes gene_type:complete
MNIFLPILPELSIFIAAISLLVLGLFIDNIKLIINLAIASILFAILLILFQPIQSAFNNSLVIDEFSKVIKILILIGSLASIIMYHSSREDLNINLFEFPILILLATIGMMIMVSANDLIAIFIGLELQSLTLYVLAALNRNHLASSEAGLKYFLLGALSSGLLLFGLSYIYGFTGNTNLNLISTTVTSGNIGLIIGIVFVCSGLAFKVSAVPFHMWTPDVYEGAPTPVTAFFALAPKVAAIALAVRFLIVGFGDISFDWQQIIIFLSIASMVFASFAAIAQNNIKRLMAYSSIGHVGYALIGLACGTFQGTSSLVIYLSIYLIMNIGVFSFILSMKNKGEYFENISDLSGLYKVHPYYSVVITIFMFSLAGIPPLAGFFGKFYIFIAAIESNLLLLAVVGILASVIGAFYYLRIIKVIYFDETKNSFDGFSYRSLNALINPSAFLILLFCIYPLPLINISNYAASSFF